MQRNKTDSVMLSTSPAFKMAGDFFLQDRIVHLSEENRFLWQARERNGTINHINVLFSGQSRNLLCSMPADRRRI